MNLALCIVLIPALLVGAGYIVIFRQLGLSPGYARPVLAAAVFFLIVFLLGRGREKRAK